MHVHHCADLFFVVVAVVAVSPIAPAGAFKRKDKPVAVVDTFEHEIGVGDEALFLDPIREETSITYFDALDPAAPEAMKKRAELRFYTQQENVFEQVIDPDLSKGFMKRRRGGGERCDANSTIVTQCDGPRFGRVRGVTDYLNFPGKRCLGGSASTVWETRPDEMLSTCITAFKATPEAFAYQFEPSDTTKRGALGLCTLMQTCNEMVDADDGTLVSKKATDVQYDSVLNWLECDCGEYGCEHVTFNVVPIKGKDLRIRKLTSHNKDPPKSYSTIGAYYPYLRRD